jgi:hypothetical protein
MTPTEYWSSNPESLEPAEAEVAFWTDPPPPAQYGNDNNGTFMTGPCANFSNLTSQHLKDILGKEVCHFFFYFLSIIL